MPKNPWTTKIAAFAALLFLPFTCLARDLREEAIEKTDDLRPVIHEMARDLWEYSEIALKETKSAELLSDLLEKNGFQVERGVAGMPTAFVATYGAGEPVIGILAEYDALPGVGNEAVPRKKPREDGLTSGQGCGHDLFGAASVGAAIAVKGILEESGISGTVKLFGCPAEETLVGKVYMARDGVFDGLDAALDWHPGTETKVKNQPGLANNSFTVEFFGKTAHGAADPWNGRSSLDAVELMNYGVNMLREHVKPSARIHYVISHGGDAPNVVPDYARVWYFVRDINRERVGILYKRVLRAAEGAALATETEYKVTFITGAHEYLINQPLQEAFQRNLEMVGPVPYTEDDQEFARLLQENLGIEKEGYKTGILPLPDQLEPASGGSTDVAEVSYLTPTAGFSVTTSAYGIPWHSWSATACHGTLGGRESAVTAAKVLAVTAMELFTDSDLVARCREAFEDATAGNEYVSPIPEGQSVILP